MANSILPKPQLLLSGAYVVRALGLHGPRFECGECGATMFVRYESGLCPRCYNGARAQHTAQVVQDVLLELEEFVADESAAN